MITTPLNSSLSFLHFASPSSPPLTRNDSSGNTATLGHCPKSPAGCEGPSGGGGGCRAHVSLNAGRWAVSVSGDMCNESDAGLDVMSAQGACL